jgi:hypothetical protein
METAVTETISNLFLEIIKLRLRAEAFTWVQSRGELIRNGADLDQLSLIFAQIPRFASKEAVGVNETAEQVSQLIPGFGIADWTIETLCRIWILLQVPALEQTLYFKKIDNLFVAAEVNELVALYYALPVLKFPELWKIRCEEGIRSNIGSVLEAIMYHNPYPMTQLSQASWNQMILKAFFTEKAMSRISGLQDRMNPVLKEALEDYVKERLAASRTVNPELYKIIMMC